MKYGIWDTKDQCWMGNVSGPLYYDDHYIARAAATIITEQFAFTRTFAVKELPVEPFAEKDTVEAKFDGEEAIRRIEGKCL